MSLATPTKPLRKTRRSIPRNNNFKDAHGPRSAGSETAVAALLAAKGGGASGFVVVFDFDGTIVRDHLWAKFRNAPIGDVPISDDMFSDLPRFRKFVRACSDAGHVIAVATFGRREVVDKAVCHALGNCHDVVILTPADFGHAEGSGALGDKNTQLAAFAEVFGVTAEQIMLIDDDKRNIEAASKAGVTTHWVPKGLTTTEIKTIAKQVGLRVDKRGSIIMDDDPVLEELELPRSLSVEATMPKWCELDMFEKDDLKGTHAPDRPQSSSPPPPRLKLAASGFSPGGAATTRVPQCHGSPSTFRPSPRPANSKFASTPASRVGRNLESEAAASNTPPEAKPRPSPRKNFGAARTPEAAGRQVEVDSPVRASLRGGTGRIAPDVDFQAFVAAGAEARPHPRTAGKKFSADSTPPPMSHHDVPKVLVRSPAGSPQLSGTKGKARLQTPSLSPRPPTSPGAR
mmetsp:Transcript_18664/g.51202  ORF Transcript_18664/g.51202 Transcript_18664/m.51202 type:complete len:458 (+) Transcript_18664:73-1446(+)